MLHKLVTGPLNMVKKVGGKIQEEADKELYDLPTIQKKLVQLQMKYELQEMSEEEYKHKEAELLERYEIAKRKELEQWKALTKPKEE
ncbi:gas vesicle protein GvpG [Virgibacillus halodenitrificans]|uniref:Gas vesicle protein GvpG n=1 Tax=Virgibacillus halodenitrificans TaxID=1482 RepID=A0AAC9NKQ3_VIRHA|nr:gas vesicle protein GvpG [Virgibacillus halodenitrificans]APC47934.1 gas vesicle protein GvpG [Virgibacillus halodenitrificans]